MSAPDLILGRFVRLACPWCGADTYAVPGVAAMACATHARAWFGAREPVRPVPGANNGLRLGQGGAVGWPHTPRAPIEVVEVALSPVVLVPECAVSPGDGAPSSVGQLVRRVSGVARYSAALYPDGPTTEPGVNEDGSAVRVPRPAFDRWKLVEWITVRWGAGGDRGFALWKRTGRGRWSPVPCWWRVDGLWRHGRPVDVPSTP